MAMNATLQVVRATGPEATKW